MTEVYFARRADGTGPIKIGVSGYVAHRLRQLSCNMKTEIVALATASGGFRDEARLHRQFANDRLEGEWFSPSDSVLSGLAHMLATGNLPPQISEDREAVMARRYRGGDTLQSIANDFGLTRERVRQLLREAGVPSLGRRDQHKRQAAPVTDFEREVAAAYAVGDTQPDMLTKHFGINYADLHAILRRTGTKRYGAGHWRKHPEDAERTKRVADLYRDGVTGKEIARLVGLGDQSHVYAYLAKAGISPSRHSSNHIGCEADLVAAYMGGETFKQVAAIFGCTIWQAKHVIRRNVPPLPKAERERRRIAAVVAANRSRTPATSPRRRGAEA